MPKGQSDAPSAAAESEVESQKPTTLETDSIEPEEQKSDEQKSEATPTPLGSGKADLPKTSDKVEREDILEAIDAVEERGTWPKSPQVGTETPQEESPQEESSKGSAGEDDTDETAGSTKRRRSRRRRGSRGKGKEESQPSPSSSQSPTTENEGEQPKEAASSPASQPSQASEQTPAGQQVGTRNTRSKSSRHRSIPSWQEAVSFIVDANLETRTKDEKPSSSSRQRNRSSGGLPRG